MVAAANLVEVAALVGDTARATMLAALMGGQSLTGTELAYVARVSRPTASEHRARLVDARLLAVTRKRRFAYYRIASPLIARMLESIQAVAAIEVPSRHQPRSAAGATLRPHLLRPHRGHGRRRPRRCTAGRWPRGLKRRWRRVDRRRRPAASALRCCARAKNEEPPRLLPAVSRLERAALSRRGFCRRRDLPLLPRAGMAHAHARHPRAAADARRTQRLGRDFRCSIDCR